MLILRLYCGNGSFSFTPGEAGFNDPEEEKADLKDSIS